MPLSPSPTDKCKGESKEKHAAQLYCSKFVDDISKSQLKSFPTIVCVTGNGMGKRTISSHGYDVIWLVKINIYAQQISNAAEIFKKKNQLFLKLKSTNHQTKSN